jgi:hypothetical protein
MDYKQALNKLRNEVFTESPVSQEVKRASFIPSRNFQKPAPKAEDMLVTAKEWLKVIRNSAENARKSYEKGQGKPDNQQSPSFGESFQKALVQRPVRSTPEQLAETASGANSEKTNWEGSVTEGGQGFLSIMDKHEGGGNYDTLFGHSQREGRAFSNVRVSEMTLGELAKFSSPSGEYGQWVKGELGRIGQRARVATPMGRYQFVGSTLREVASKMGLSDDTVFTPEVQDQMFEFYLKQNLAESNTEEGKVAALRGAWEGFKNVPTEELVGLIRRYES